MHEEEAIGGEIQHIVFLEVVLGDVHRCTRCTSRHECIYAALNLTWEAHVLIEHFTACLAKDVINRAINQRYFVLHSRNDFTLQRYTFFLDKQNKKVDFCVKIHLFIKNISIFTLLSLDRGF